jgi:hypothetical protein
MGKITITETSVERRIRDLKAKAGKVCPTCGDNGLRLGLVSTEVKGIFITKFRDTHHYSCSACGCSWSVEDDWR